MKKAFEIVAMLSLLSLSGAGYSKEIKKVKLNDLSIPSKSKDFQGQTVIPHSGRNPQSIETDTDQEIKLRHKRLREFSERMLDLRDRK